MTFSQWLDTHMLCLMVDRQSMRIATPTHSKKMWIGIQHPNAAKILDESSNNFWFMSTFCKLSRCPNQNSVVYAVSKLRIVSIPFEDVQRNDRIIFIG